MRSSARTVLDADEIAALVKRGQDFATNGDLVSAHLLLRRAAEAAARKLHWRSVRHSTQSE